MLVFTPPTNPWIGFIVELTTLMESPPLVICKPSLFTSSTEMKLWEAPVSSIALVVILSINISTKSNPSLGVLLELASHSSVAFGDRDDSGKILHSASPKLSLCPLLKSIHEIEWSILIRHVGDFKKHAIQLPSTKPSHAPYPPPPSHHHHLPPPPPPPLWIPRRTQLHFRRQGITGPPYRPFIGNAGDIRKLAAAALSQPMPKLCHDILWRVDPRYALWSAAHGKTFLFWFGTRPRLAFAEPEMVKEVLLNTGGGGGEFERMQETPIVKYLLGDGLFRLRGPKWAKHRRIISPAFNMERVKEWVPVMVESTMRMVKKWDKENEGKTTFEIEVHKELHNFTAEVISRVAFGSSYDEGKRIFQLQEEQMINVSHAIRQVYIPGFRFLPTESNKRMWRIDKEIQELLKKLVQSNRDTDKNSRYLLNRMISAKKHQKREERIETQEIIEECKAFYFAGKETGANFLTWVLILLALYPDWQQKVREEVLKICGQQNVPEAEDLGKLNLVSSQFFILIFKILYFKIYIQSLNHICLKYLQV
ncbi:cytochrome P450 734A1-like [Phalaenopsis equestris]|uniref:cytochrome P450 734A1-like n=1 Tax=Phalaenopsis equestris TaxID=78828 RepID=UPI0009E501F7|nr:cytochrome P450 734A1-like [Phalaenopsis equestris]